MQIKAETGEGKKKKHNRFAFILRRQWVRKWISLRKELAFLPKQEILSCSGPAVPTEPDLMV